MVLVVYDIAAQKPRRAIERLLREASFVFLFRNARRAEPPVEIGRLTRALSHALRGEAFRILVVDLPPRATVKARWLHGSATRKTI
jgi:CRISPR/Cas system-associated endoribonuclease Cas2